MRTIWKYALSFPPDALHSFDIPHGARPIRVAMQHGRPCIWMFVPNTNAPTTRRNFVIIGTGHPAPEPEQGYYLGSFHLLEDNFVGHIFADWPGE